MNALLYLTLCSMRNRFRVRIKRLKEPRYLIGTVVGLAYFFLVFGRQRTTRNGNPAGMLSIFARARPMLELIGAAGLFIVTALAWVWPGRSRPALAFSKADVQFLFPAPFTRRELIRYRVLRSQIGVLFGSAFMTLFFRPSSFASSWMFFLGVALTMTILNLHLTGVSLSRESLGSHGVAGLARQWLPLAFVVGAVLVLGTTIATHWSALGALDTGDEVVDEVARLASTGAAGIVLWPFRAVTRLPTAQTPLAFARALPWALGILALNYVWVVRSDARFEEASAEFAEKVARIRRGPAPVAPKKRAATPFNLALEGRPEMAIFWKNLILLGRYASLKMLLRFLPIFIVFGVMLTRGSGQSGMSQLFATLCGVVFMITLLMGPQLARNDLRQDLANLAVLRTWPVRGASIVRGEILAPVALLTVIAWLCTIGGMILATRLRVPVTYPIAAALVAPGIILVQILMQNAIAVMWPSWVMGGADRSRGIDVMGQRMIMMFGLLVVLVVAVLPAALAAAAVFFPFYMATGAIHVVLPALAAAIVLFIEAFIGTELVGKLLDRTDVSSIDAAEG